MQKVITIVGPTASGKTALAIELATKFNGEIISADSRAVYRGLDIGTAKPTPEEQRLVKHHLIDIANVGGRFTVVQFQKLATEAIDEITKRGKIPFLVGGTGLYVDAVLKGYKFPPEGDPELRYHLEQESDEQLLEMLKTIDRKSYQQIDHKNRRRVIRALEVAFGTGRSFVELGRTHKSIYNTLIIGISTPRKKLYERIDRRFEQWLNQGLIKEVQWALQETLPEWVSSLGLHYRYLAQHVLGEIGAQEAYRESLQSLRQYAKRQITWFKRDKNVHWVDNKRQAIELVRQFLTT